MSNLVVDSWAWLELFSGSEKGNRIRRELESAPQRYTTSINLFEVLYRLTADGGREAATRGLEIIENNSTVVSIDAPVASEAVEVKLGEKLHALDALSLAAARLNHAMFITGDADFRGKKDVLFIE